jgi:hypothetical protein
VRAVTLTTLSVGLDCCDVVAAVRLLIVADGAPFNNLMAAVHNINNVNNSLLLLTLCCCAGSFTDGFCVDAVFNVASLRTNSNLTVLINGNGTIGLPYLRWFHYAAILLMAPVNLAPISLLLALKQLC